MFSWSLPPSRVTNPPLQHPRHPTAPVTVAAVTTVFYSRRQHLQSFLTDEVLCRSIRRISKNDDTTYDAAFQTISGVALYLRVHLPQREGALPSMFLWGIKASHPWLREEGFTNRVIGYSPIASTEEHWQSCNILLGKAVNEVIQHFQCNPPTVFQFTDKSLERLQPKTDTLDISIPQVPTSFPELDSMTIKQVENTLLLDEASWKAWVLTKTLSAEMKNLHNFHQELLTANYNFAKSNLSEENQLQTLNQDVETLKKEFMGNLEKFRQLEISYKKIFGSTEEQHRKTLRLLHVAEREAFKESEEYGNHWLSDEDNDSTNMSIDDFIKGFMAKRKLYHKRAATMERLSSTSTFERS